MQVRFFALTLSLFASNAWAEDSTTVTERPSQAPAAIEAHAVPTPATAESTSWAQTIDARLSALEAQPHVPAPAPSTAHESLRHTLNAIVEPLASHADVGIAVKDLHTGRLVFEHHGEDQLNPASNHKLLTATAAVSLLGADYRFETVVRREGDTLYVVGGGDPSLQVEDLEAIALHVDTRGLRRIVVDDSMFSSRNFGPGYDADGPGVSYMAPSGALSLQYNTVVVEVRPGSRAGAPVRIDTNPPCSHLHIESSATTGSGRPSVTTAAGENGTIVRVGGRHRGGVFRIRRRISDPAGFTGAALAVALGQPELPIEHGIAPSTAPIVHTHRSAPLPKVLGSALKFSNNFTTEQVLRTLGHHAANAPGDWENGSAVLRRFWKAVGQDLETLTFENASGLSNKGRVTPRAMVDLMALWTDDEDAAAILDVLPIAGREGTLRGRLRRSGGRVRAKTGTLQNASGLSGVVTHRDGTPRYAFSVLVNGKTIRGAKRLEDRVVMALLRG